MLELGASGLGPHGQTHTMWFHLWHHSKLSLGQTMSLNSTLSISPLCWLALHNILLHFTTRVILFRCLCCYFVCFILCFRLIPVVYICMF
jgi:hypothetical protein